MEIKEQMKAVVWTEYGPPDVLQLKEVEKPTPKDNEVLIRIHATEVSSGDCAARKGSSFLARLFTGLTRPRQTIMGSSLAGEIEAMGKDVRLFEEGDQVFGATGFIGMGTCAEYICLPEKPEGGALAIKPVNISYEEAASVPNGGLEALCFLRQGNIQSRQKVLINGAGGTVGPFAVQLAKYFGAEVTAVDSTEKLDMLLGIGADSVIDYTKKNFTESLEAYDLILDLVGKSSFAGSIRSLKKNGCYFIANPGPSKRIRGLWTKIISSKKVIGGNAKFKNEDLIYLKELIEAGKLKSVIGRTYPLEQTAEAHRYVESG
jgi:NADPH:quinone reductase-like Zn-dependent oxidoreductase